MAKKFLKKIVKKMPTLSINDIKKIFLNFELQGGKFLRYAICVTQFKHVSRQFRTKNRNQKFSLGKTVLQL